MMYIFNFRYRPNTELNLLNDFVKVNKLKWKSRNVNLNDDIRVTFTTDHDFDVTYNFKKMKDSGIAIDSIERDNGKFIEILQICS